MNQRYVLSFVIIGVVLVGYVFYYQNLSNEGLLKKVINRDGYILNQVNKSVPIKFFIKPEWIPVVDKKEKIKVEILENNNTEIILDHVRNRGDDIYFSFTNSYNLNRKNGRFLYNQFFNEDGSSTDTLRDNDIILYTENNERIEVGQRGIGPDSDFSFGIKTEDYEKIKNGFYVEYSGFILYEYLKE